MKNFSKLAGLLVIGLMSLSAHADGAKCAEAFVAMKELFAKAKAPALNQLQMGRSWDCVQYSVSKTNKLITLKRKGLFVFNQAGDKISNKSINNVVETFTPQETALIGNAYGNISAIRATEHGDLIEMWMNPQTNQVLSYSFCANK